MKTRPLYPLLYVLLLALGVSCVFTQTQAPIHIKFLLKSPDLPDTTTVYITGGPDELGNWDPGKVKMETKGGHQWSKEITIPGPLSIEYKFTLGSWEREGADSKGMPLHNLIVKVSGDTTINNDIHFWTKGKRERVNYGQITGTVKYHRALKGAGLADRDLIVWLPPEYEKNKSERYPVIYMQDGQNIIDPVTSSFGVDWRIDETVDSLIKAKSISPVIVVGIYNTSDRMKEYVPGEKGTAYMNFVVKVVKPFIDSVYRTKPDRDNTIVGGSSAGGTISFMLVWEHPDVFSKAICMSPAFELPRSMRSNWDYVETVRSSGEKRTGVFFYMDIGGVGLETELQPGVEAMVNALKSKGYVEGKDFVYVHDEKAEHFEAAWAKRFPGALLDVMKVGR